MPSNLTAAEFAVKESIKELRLGKKQAARSWALKAIALSPQLEEPWLIMGHLASPEASLPFFREALKINPGSPRAQQGLTLAYERARKMGQVLNINIPLERPGTSLPPESPGFSSIAKAVHFSPPAPIQVTQAPVPSIPEQAEVVPEQAKQNQQKSQLRYKRRVGLWLIAPWLIGLVLLKLGPILITLGMSFTNMDLLEPFKFSFVGVKNYIELFHDPRVGTAFLGTLKSAVTLIPLQVLAAVSLASILSSPKLHHKNTYRMLFFLPSIIAAYPAYLMWAGITDPNSGWLYTLFINPLGLAKLFNSVGIGINPLVKLLSTLWTIGPGFLIMMGAMQSISPDIYEAARVDGANRLRNFFSITIPLISPAIFFTIILNLTTLFGGSITFDAGYAFKTDLSSVDAFLYELGFYSFHIGAAASLAWIFFFFMLVVVLILFLTSKYWVYFPDQEN